MEEINKLRRLYHLKHVDRFNSVLKRKESSAEHSWSCLILADYFLNLMKDRDIDRLKVYELLLYHDVVEIEAGDIGLLETEKRKDKKENERKAMLKLKEEFPKSVTSKFEILFNEFEAAETKDAKFAKAIDKMDALIHEMDYKEDWKGWTEKMVREFYEKEIKDFFVIKEAFERILIYVTQEGYFTQ
ncbi:HD domain-containing protein [Candidatus Woesearchaeota archaeon]|nr:HD domain-containing protein [Candidatus Woesearchaeota archaeon]